MIVVTGAAGFIGSNLVADLEQRGSGPIVAVDWFYSDQRWRNLAKRAVWDYVQPEHLRSFLDRHRGHVRAVLHMGAISATTETNVDLLVERNIRCSLDLWDWCTAAAVPFLYASSAATYGARERAFVDDDRLPALQSLAPLNPYGWSKSAIDLALVQRAAEGKAPPQWVGLKFFNVYGPNEYHKGNMESVISRFYRVLGREPRIQLFKSYRQDIAHGEQRRDFVYVRDCSRIVLDLLERPNISGIFNVGTGTARSFLDVARVLFRLRGLEPQIEFIDMPPDIKDRYQYVTQADMAKLAGTGISVQFAELEAGIEDYVARYLSCSDPYR